ncbi:MAG: hypothetical protein R6X02_28860 [Enhygromyxa sp.]
MRKFPSISITFLGLALSFGLVACNDDGGDDGMADGTGDGDGDGDQTGDGDGETGDGDGDETGDGDPGCFEAPDVCLRFVSCIGDILPEQQDAVSDEYGEGGSCWCSGEDKAQECYSTCVNQLDAAIEQFPTASACHPKSCGLDELDPEQPYGPVVNGSCPEWSGLEQIPLNNPFGIAGSVCSPPCSGIAQSCPDHTQTVAEGTCYLTVGDTNYCVSRCWVNSVDIFPSGTQCQCGATCQPVGGADGEGNLRGVCTFE